MSTENGNNGHSAATDCSLVVGVNDQAEWNQSIQAIWNAKLPDM